MKFSKSGILTLSGMLIANSFLLMATTYAKNIDTNPANAQQEIKSVHFIEGEKEKVCSLVLFDISGSMKDYKCCKTRDSSKNCIERYDDTRNGKCDYDTSKYKPFPQYKVKWDGAVNGAIEYSRNILDGNPNARIGLILFGDDAYYNQVNSKRRKGGAKQKCMYNQTSCYYGQALDSNELDKNNFGYPEEYTYLGRGLYKANEIFSSDDAADCDRKTIVIITDGVPTSDEAKYNYKTLAKELKDKGVTIYSLGYKIYGNGATNLSSISEGFFYNADEDNIDEIFKYIAQDQNDKISVYDNKLKITSNNFILTKYSPANTNSNKIEGNSNYSSTLGGINNIITSSDSSIVIAGESNSIQLSQNSTVLGGQLNSIVNKSNENNSILGGKKNQLKNGKNSTIIGGSGNTTNGEYTAIAGNNSTVVGKNSVALGNKTKISANNSFYWTDTSHAGVLKKDNVFAVVSNKGMAVNTNNPNANAQLTINGSLVVIDSENDTQIQCGDGNGNGILKVVKKNENEKCFCSCDGSSRKSLYNGSCEYLCNTNMKPVCGTTVTLECKDGYKMYSGSCNSGVAINTSYYVTSNNKVHWACQTYDGKTVNCSGTLSTNNAGNCDVGGETSKCTSTRPQTCPEICSSPAISFSLNNPNYGNGTSNDPIFQINSKITECVNSCGTPATKTCDDVTWVNCCKN